jgi:hypothetical protein
MKKSLSKILARMAKDGDIETVAEIIEEMIEPEGAETPAEAVAEAVAEVAPVVAAAASESTEPEAVIETPEATIVVDEATLADIISRLDQIIDLLKPAPITDEDPIEEIAEAVEEALEAISAEEPSFTEEPIFAEELAEGIQPEDVDEIIEEIMEPVSEILELSGDECGEENQEVLTTGDALRTALRAVGPTLIRVPEKQRLKLSDDLAARLKKSVARRGKDSGIYTGFKGSKRGNPRSKPTDLGKRIMASRNVNCRN